MSKEKTLGKVSLGIISLVAIILFVGEVVYSIGRVNGKC